MDNTNKDLYVEKDTYENNVEEVITETKEPVEEILKPAEAVVNIIDTDVNVSELIKDTKPSWEPLDIKLVVTDPGKVAVRMISWHKWYRSGDDLLLTKKELKAIPRLKYKLI